MIGSMKTRATLLTNSSLPWIVLLLCVFFQFCFMRLNDNTQKIKEIKGSYVGPSKCSSLFCWSSLHASLIVKQKLSLNIAITEWWSLVIPLLLSQWFHKELGEMRHGPTSGQRLLRMESAPLSLSRPCWWQKRDAISWQSDQMTMEGLTFSRKCKLDKIEAHFFFS